MSLKAVILVGGETTGTRFRPLSMDVPKVLFPIAGKPLISHIIDTLVNQLGKNELNEILLLGFFKDNSKFENYVMKVKAIYPSLKIKYLSEPYSMGTAGGLYYFRNEIFNTSVCERLLVIHGDVICNYPFKEMLNFYDSNKAKSVILGIDPLLLTNNYQNKIQVQNHNSFKTYERDKIFSNYGTIISDKSSNMVVHYVEKPSSKFSKFHMETNYNILINGGIYLLDKSILKLLEESQLAKLNSSNKFSNYDDLENDSVNPNILSLELDVLKILPNKKDSVFLTFKSNSFWYQLKTPISAILANNFFLEQSLQLSSFKDLANPSINIIPPVKILNSDFQKSINYKIGPTVSIGNNVTIGNGVRIKNSIIADNVSIGDHSYIANAIISKGVKIGKWCRIEGTINSTTISKDINQLNSDGYFKLINNIVVLCENTIVNNQVFVYNSIVLPHKELKNDVKYEIVM